MDYCMDGTITMPSSYAVMDEDEMCYTEGGVDIASMSKSQCIDALCQIGINSPQVAIAGALTYTLAACMVRKLSTICGLAAKVISTILTWAAGQVVQLGVAIARGALNRGVDIYWNWNVFQEPVGVGYNVR